MTAPDAGEQGSSLVLEGLGKTRLLDMAVDFEIVDGFEHEAW
jgi:hypothetical protein